MYLRYSTQPVALFMFACHSCHYTQATQAQSHAMCYTQRAPAASTYFLWPQFHHVIGLKGPSVTKFQLGFSTQTPAHPFITLSTFITTGSAHFLKDFGTSGTVILYVQDTSRTSRFCMKEFARYCVQVSQRNKIPTRFLYTNSSTSVHNIEHICNYGFSTFSEGLRHIWYCHTLRARHVAH